jgi:hypothetical protein
MAGTRNKNTPGNYCLDTKQDTQQEEWRLYTNGANGYAYNTNLAGNGFLQGPMPWNKLANNPADIESFLFGIGSNNLVNPPKPFTPELTDLSQQNLYDKANIIMPIPLVVPKEQRPFKP